MTPLLEEALKSLTIRVNLATGLSHPLDSDSAKEIFKLLHKHGEILLKSDITNWAITNDWSSKHTDELGSLAQKIGEGKRVQIKNKDRWKEDIIQLLEARVNETHS